MKPNPLRWGILGTADIARKNWAAICHSGNGIVTAVASRDRERSGAFIDACQARAPFAAVPAALGSYKELLASPQVDAVYIPLPTGLRKEWVLRAAEEGKHVVCEKPCGASLAEIREMTEACARHGVQFMDGVMFMHSARLGRIREVLGDDRSVGKIKRMVGQFSFRAPDDFFRENIRMHSGLEPHGCVGDLGWYCIRFFLWAMDWQMPREVTGRLLSSAGRSDSPNPVPVEFSGELIFDEGISASFYCSFQTELQQWVNVSGDKGYLTVEDFVLPRYGSELAFHTHHAVFNASGWDFNMEARERRHAVSEYSNNTDNAQETLLFRNFSSQVASGKLNPSWPEMALKTQEVLEACLAAAARGRA